MSYLLACVKDRKNSMQILKSDVEVYELPNNLNNSKEYDCNDILEDDEWFKVSNFSESDYSIDFLNTDFISTEHNTIEARYKSLIKYLCYYNDEIYYFQKVTPSIYAKKTFISLSGEYAYKKDEPVLFINRIPDAIYNKEEDALYFKKLENLSNIFPNISNLYREATEEETKAFLDLDIINLQNGYDYTHTGTNNRKRIALALQTFNGFTDTERDEISKYTREYCNGLRYDEENKKFSITDENDLKQLLFAIEQRYYTTIIGHERRLASKVAKVNE